MIRVGEGGLGVTTPVPVNEAQHCDDHQRSSCEFRVEAAKG